MAAKKGNRYWEFRNKHGRDYKYTPTRLWNEFVKYCKWLEKNPLKEQKLFGTGLKDDVNRLRAMTLTGFCVFADICIETFEAYRKSKNEDFIRVTKKIDAIIYSQKFEGAAAGLLNPVIIARDLGLADKQEHEHSATQEVVDMMKKNEKEVAEIVDRVQNKLKKEGVI